MIEGPEIVFPVKMIEYMVENEWKVKTMYICW